MLFDLTDRLYQAFELCRAGDFNLSHASLTSAQALTALRELPTTNLTLHSEISAGKTDVNAHDLNEPAFPVDAPNDGSDIPIDVVRSAVMSEGVIVDESFEIDDHGAIFRTGVAKGLEEIEAVENIGPVVLGRGRRQKLGQRSRERSGKNTKISWT